MGLLGVLLAGEAAGGEGLRLSGARIAAGGRKGREVPLNQRDERVPVIVAGDGHDHVFRGVMARPVALKRIAAIAADQVRRAQDGAAKRSGILRLAEQVVHEVLGGILHHGDLLQDHAALLLQLPRVKHGAKREVGENIHGQGQLVVGHLGVKAGAFLAGEGVELAAGEVHLLGDVARGAVLRALENHVLDEVAQAVFLRQLVHAAHPDPHAHRAAAHMRQALARQAQAAGQGYEIKHRLRSFPC